MTTLAALFIGCFVGVFLTGVAIWLRLRWESKSLPLLIRPVPGETGNPEPQEKVYPFSSGSQANAQRINITWDDQYSAAWTRSVLWGFPVLL